MLQSKFILAFPVLALLAAAGFSRASASVPAHFATASASRAAETSQAARRLTLNVAPSGSEARYRVREQLVGVSLPGDAVGRTSKVSGAIVIESNGRVVKEGSKFVVDLTSITTDVSMRDGFVRRNTLQTDQFPNAEFIPTGITGLPSSIPVAADLAFKMTGDFTVHGVTKPATWDVKGKMVATGEFTGTATTGFKFGDYGLTIPRVPRVMSVVDSIRLELDLHLVPGTPPS